MMKKLFALVLLSALFVGGTVSSASAAKLDDYPPHLVSGPSGILAGGSGLFSFENFSPSEVTVALLSGESVTSFSLASLGSRSDVETVSLHKQASSEGQVEFTVTLPEQAEGVYELTVTGEDSGKSTTVTIVVSEKADVGGSGDLDEAPDLSWVVWLVGATLLVVALLVLLAARRRRRSED